MSKCIIPEIIIETSEAYIIGQIFRLTEQPSLACELQGERWSTIGLETGSRNRQDKTRRPIMFLVAVFLKTALSLSRSLPPPPPRPPIQNLA